MYLNQREKVSIKRLCFSFCHWSLLMINRLFRSLPFLFCFGVFHRSLSSRFCRPRMSIEMWLFTSVVNCTNKNKVFSLERKRRTSSLELLRFFFLFFSFILTSVKRKEKKLLLLVTIRRDSWTRHYFYISIWLILSRSLQFNWSRNLKAMKRKKKKVSRMIVHRCSHFLLNFFR